MSKIIVPQELASKIVELYQAGKNRVEIKKILELSFGDSVIKRVLEENGVNIRTNNGAKQGGRKKQKVDFNIQQQIIDLYVNKQYGLNKIVRELNLPFSFDKVKDILKENNIHIRNCAEANAITIDNTDFRKYSINDDYNLVSHNGAWLLGFIAADGYLPDTKGAKSRIVITLSAVDKNVLELIKQELGYTGPIYEFESSLINGKTYPTVSLSFSSAKLRAQIEKYGIVNNKTFKLKTLPELPKEYLLDFIKGYFDGDGSVFDKEGRGKPHLSITSANEDFLQEIKDYLKTTLNLKYGGSISPDKNVFQISWGSQDSELIGDIFYNNDYLALPRKKEKYLSLRNKLPRA